jgi:predicted nucleic acid-binding protein
MAFQTVYWDAAVFHALFGKEAGRVEICEKVEQAARAGSIHIYTSTATFVECVWLKGVPNRLDSSHEAEISKYFQNSFIRPVLCDRLIAERARALIWKFYPGLKPKDAIHLASALFIGVDVLHTYDSDLLKLSGKIGNPAMKIEEPKDPFPPPPPPPEPSKPTSPPTPTAKEPSSPPTKQAEAVASTEKAPQLPANPN